jgi:hypothetical protein
LCSTPQATGSVCGIPGISDDILLAASALAAKAGCPLVLFGSRQTGISEKDGRPFREESDVDLGVLNPENLMNEFLVETLNVNRFHPKFEHGIAGLFSPQEVMERGYLIVFP